MTLKEKIKAPNFSLLDEKGDEHSLLDYQGKNVVLYFYPRDNTKGCTTEACNFRDDYSEYEKANVTIIGISPDSVKSHSNFVEKYTLPFTLLADQDHKVCELYGVWGLKKFMGREYMGVFRTTYLIDKEGTIKKVYENVKPAGHSQEILADLSE